MHIVCATQQHQWLLLGSQNRNPQTMEQTHESHEGIGDKESPKACIHLKICESLDTCPRCPFTGDEKTFTFRDYP
jgi:hypothetical protein